MERLPCASTRLLNCSLYMQLLARAPTAPALAHTMTDRYGNPENQHEQPRQQQPQQSSRQQPVSQQNFQHSQNPPRDSHSSPSRDRPSREILSKDILGRHRSAHTRDTSRHSKASSHRSRCRCSPGDRYPTGR
jgi:hypothetical protein